MSTTIATYVGNGAQTDFTFSFDYLRKEFVKVLVDGAEVPFTFHTPQTIKIIPAPAVDKVIIIRRDTDRARLVTFVDGSVLLAGDLNVAQLQAIHIAAEALDAASGSLLIDQNGAYSAGFRRLADLGNPTNSRDAVTKEWAETSGTSILAQTITARNQAQAFANDAGNAASTAVSGRLEKAQNGADIPNKPAFRTALGATTVGAAVFTAADAAAARLAIGAQSTNPTFLSTQATQDGGFAGGLQLRNDGSGQAAVAFDANIRGAIVGGLHVQDTGFWGTAVRLLANRTGGSDGDRRFAAYQVNSDGAQFTAHQGAPATLLPKFDCRAWVNFNGTNGSIRASGNVSSVVRNGVGDYTVNFSTAMPDANYAVAGFANYGPGAATAGILTAGNGYAPLAGSVRIRTGDSATGVGQDAQFVNVAIFR
jgi:hypothetical protein